MILATSFNACREKSEFENENEAESISITGYKTIMPHAAGYEAFESNCITCHSLRYIQMQPDFPQKKWETIVDKMVKSFGAPIPDSTAKRIVAYLTEVKGVK